MTYKELRLELEKILNNGVYLDNKEDKKHISYLHEFSYFITIGVLNDEAHNNIDTIYPPFNTLSDNLKHRALTTLIKLIKASPKDRNK